MKTIFHFFAIAILPYVEATAQAELPEDNLILIAEGYIEKADFRPAIQNLDSALRLARQPNDRKYLLTKIGYCYYELNHMFEGSKSDDENALFYVNKALELDLGYSYAIYVRSRIYINQRNYAEAIEDLTFVLTTSPDDLLLYMYRADAYRALKKRRLAKRDYIEARKIAIKQKKDPSLIMSIDRSIRDL